MTAEDIQAVRERMGPGASNREVAEELGISEHSLYRKLREQTPPHGPNGRVGERGH